MQGCATAVTARYAAPAGRRPIRLGGVIVAEVRGQAGSVAAIKSPTLPRRGVGAWPVRKGTCDDY